MKNIFRFVILLLFLFGCSKQESSWKEAKKMNSINSYDEYIKLFPTSSFVTEARTNISNLIIQMIKERYFNDSYSPNSNYDYPLLWNGVSFYKLGGQKIENDGEMGRDGNLVPVRGKTTATISFPDNTLTIQCLYSNEGKYELKNIKIAENTIVEMKSGIKYKYLKGQFERQSD